MRFRPAHRHLALWPAVVLLSSAGCTRSEPPALRPAAAASLTHAAGNLLGATQPPAERAADASVWAVDAAVFAVTDWPPRMSDLELLPASPSVRLAGTTGGAFPVRADLGVAGGVLLGVDRKPASPGEPEAAPGASAELSQFATALVPGMFTELTVRADAAGDGEAAGERVSVRLRRPTADEEDAPTVQLALEVTATPAEAPADLLADDATQKAAPESAFALFEPIAVEQGVRVVLAVPFDLDHAPLPDGRTPRRPKAAGVVYVMSVLPDAGEPHHLEAADRAVAEARQAHETQQARPVVHPRQVPSWPGYEQSLAAVAEAATRRRALVYLAGKVDAPVCHDVALTADEALLGQLADAVLDEASRVDVERTPETLGFVMEVATIRLAAEAMSRDSTPDSLTVALGFHAGQAGRSAASLEEVLRNLAGRADLKQRLVAENTIYLEDAEPAARVRAYDWLRAHDAAPTDYDPLGPARERRRALADHLERMAQTTVDNEERE